MLKSWKGKIALLLFGAALGWFGWPAAKSLMRAEPAAGVSAAALADQAEAERQKVIPDALACPCGGEAVCSGPRGGLYCVDVEGRKKYKPKG